MSSLRPVQKMTAPKLFGMKRAGERIVCLTAYDVVMGAIADAAGVDLVMVGDSLGNVILGYESTLPVSLDDMLHHTRAVRKGVTNALLVADMPFGSYQASVEQAVDSAIALAKAGAEAVKLEGAYSDQIRAIIRAGVPVMGHVGMTPQSMNNFGGFRVQGKGDDAHRVMEDAQAVDEAGVFSVVLELIPHALAYEITQAIDCPTIGIGAGPGCDGQVQVFHDLLGLGDFRPKHAAVYCEGRTLFQEAIMRYAEEVRSSAFAKDEKSA